MRVIGRDDHIARPVLMISATRQRNDSLRWPARTQRAWCICKTHDFIGVGDVEVVVAVERHAERLRESFCEDGAHFGTTITVAIAQYRDASGGLGHEDV